MALLLRCRHQTLTNPSFIRLFSTSSSNPNETSPESQSPYSARSSYFGQQPHDRQKQPPQRRPPGISNASLKIATPSFKFHVASAKVGFRGIIKNSVVNHRQVLNHSHYCSLRFASSSSRGYFVLDAKCFDHPYKDWQGQRQHKLTASTFAAAVGFFPRRRLQLWLEKIGAIEPFSKNMAISWTNITIEKALGDYLDMTKNSVLIPEFQAYTSINAPHDWLGASPDGVVDSADGSPSQGVLNIKCPYFGGDMSGAIPWKRIPIYCVPQAQGLMEILNKDWMHLYVWTARGCSLFKIDRDAEYWDALEQVLSDFWWNHVQPAREIYSQFQITDPLVELRSLKPAPRHERWSYLVNQSKHMSDKAERLWFIFHTDPNQHANIKVRV